MNHAAKPNKKNLLTFWSIILLFLFYNEATAVQAVKHKQQVNSQPVREWMTADVVNRANSDVQLRRLMKLFYAKKIESEDLYKHLRKLRSKP